MLLAVQVSADLECGIGVYAWLSQQPWPVIGGLFIGVFAVLFGTTNLTIDAFDRWQDKSHKAERRKGVDQ